MHDCCIPSGARLKGWRRTESDGRALYMSYVPNGTKGHKCVPCITFAHIRALVSGISFPSRVCSGLFRTRAQLKMR
jgi:hypothetical protein